MAGTLIRTGFLVAILALGIAPGARADDAAPLRYEIRFPMHGDRLDAVEVRATARIGADGRIDFVAPWQGAAEVHAESGTLDTSAGGHWIVKAKPGDDIVLVWRSRPAQAWRHLDDSLWRSVLVRPDAMSAAGGALLALPDVPRNRPAEMHWSAPTGWTVSTTFTQGTQTTGALRDGTFMMALHGATATRTMNDHTIRVMALDPQRADVGRVADDIVSIVNKVTPPAMQHDFTLNIVDLDGDNHGLSINGNATGGMVYLLPPVTYDTWIPFVIGAATMPAEDKVNPASAWYTQGFTAFRTVDLVRDARLASPGTLAYLFNQATTQYGDSPLRRAPNRRVVAEYRSIRELRDLPPARGALFAMLLDDRIRKATGGARSLEDALSRMPVPATNDPGPALIDAVSAVGGGDITPLYQRYIVDGELLQLPSDALAPCFTVGTVADGSGWQTQHVFARPGCPTRIAGAP